MRDLTYFITILIISALAASFYSDSSASSNRDRPQPTAQSDHSLKDLAQLRVSLDAVEERCKHLEEMLQEAEVRDASK